MATLVAKLQSLQELFLADIVDADYYVKEVTNCYVTAGFSVPPITLPKKAPPLDRTTVTEAAVPSAEVTLVQGQAPATQHIDVADVLTLNNFTSQVPVGCPSPKKSKSDSRVREPWVSYVDEDGEVLKFATKEEAKQFKTWMELSCQWANFRANGGSGCGGKLLNSVLTGASHVSELIMCFCSDGYKIQVY